MKKQNPKATELNLDLEPIAGKFATAVSNGLAREIACFGTRGDGKTFAALIAMVMHSVAHKAAGYPVPVPWMGATDTHRSHELKTCRTLESPAWQGAWKLYDSNRVAVFRQGSTDLVHLDLFGVEDREATNRLRMETCGIWFEEPAPASVLVTSAGIDDTAWSVALTSQRIPSHCKPAIMTLNYPDEDHWTWQRFLPGSGTSGVHPDHPDRMWFRIPPGERASAEDRAEWQRALAERPDLMRRLLEGQPGTIMLGQQVAQGFNQDIHVSRERLLPIANEPLYLGQDFGLTPATVIGQPRHGEIRVLAALPCERGGIRQHLENSVIPWLRVKTPWVFRSRGMIHGQYDPAAPDSQDDSDQNPVRTLESMLPGSWWYPGPVSWEERKGPLLTSMQRRLLLDPVDCRPLIQALSGRWYYTQDRLGAVVRDVPKKNHPWSDLGDAFCYFLCGVMPEMNERAMPREPVTIVTEFETRRLP